MERVIKLLLLFLLIPAICLGAINEKYSYKDFLKKDFSGFDASEFNNSTIVGSCFAQDGEPEQDIFPDGLENVIFEKCNLDNVKIKAGMTLGDGNTNKMIQVQNDLEDWVVEKKLGQWKAKEPIDKERFIELEISIDHKDIPNIKQDKSATEEKQNEINSIDHP